MKGWFVAILGGALLIEPTIGFSQPSSVSAYPRRLSDAAACALMHDGSRSLGNSYAMTANFQYNWEYGNGVQPIGCDRGLTAIVSPEAKTVIDNLKQEFASRCGAHLLMFEIAGELRGSLVRDQKPSVGIFAGPRVRVVRFRIDSFVPSRTERPLGECPAN